MITEGSQVQVQIERSCLKKQCRDATQRLCLPNMPEALVPSLALHTPGVMVHICNART